MHYYLVRPLEGIRVPEILNYNEVVPYKAFQQNRPGKIAKRTVCILQNRADLEEVLLFPLPLFGENARKSLNLFWWDRKYRELIFLDRAGSGSRKIYFLPFFPRIEGKVQKEALVILKKPIPEDIPAVYVEEGERIHVILRLDLVESLLRNGLCGVNLQPVSLITSRNPNE